LRGKVQKDESTNLASSEAFKIFRRSTQIGDFEAFSPSFSWYFQPFRKASTNVLTGLSQKAGHPKDQLYELHGSLLDIKCSNKECDYYDKDNMDDPVCPALAVDAGIRSFAPKLEPTPANEPSVDEVASNLSTMTVKNGKKKKKVNVPDYEPISNPLADIIAAMSPVITDEMRAEPVPDISELPQCPRCSSLLRPGVVWFGESLSRTQYDEIIAWIDEERKLDLMIVIGTKGEVYPAGRFVDIAKEKGARICVVNMDKDHIGSLVVREGKDWVFEGDAAEILPVLFEGVLLN